MVGSSKGKEFEVVFLDQDKAPYVIFDDLLKAQSAQSSISVVDRRKREKKGRRGGVRSSSRPSAYLGEIRFF